jgi:hypothetical protein
MTYTHSESFALLKDSQEGILENLTSHQWLSTLDYFLEAALDPIATANPDLMDNYFSKVVATQFNYQYTKFSRTKKEELPTLLFNAITSSGRRKREHQKKMLLNRGILFGLLSIFQDSVKNYKQLHSPFTKIDRISRLGLILRQDSPFLYAALAQTEFWADRAYKFKTFLVQKYIRLSLMSAQRLYKELNHGVPLDDIVQVYLAYLSKAIDRCDSRQGVLTTFIQTWFYSARTKVKALMNRDSPYYDSEEADSGNQISLPYEAIQHLASEAKKVDHNGLVRYSLSIPEFFTREQLAVLTLFQNENCK